MYPFNEKETELIEAYHLNTISADDKILLDDKLANDPDFRTAFDEYIVLLQAMDIQRRNQTRNFLKSLDTDHSSHQGGNFKNIWIWIIIAILSIGLMVYFMVYNKVPSPGKEQKSPKQTQEEPDTTLNNNDTLHNSSKSYLLADAAQSIRSEIAKQYFSDPEFGITRSSENDSLTTELVNMFVNKQYKAVIKKAPTRLLVPELKLMLATAYYHTGNWKKSALIFSELKQHAGGLKEEAQWYLLLCYLNDKDQSENFKKVAAEILSDPQHSYYTETKNMQRLLKIKNLTDYITN